MEGGPSRPRDPVAGGEVIEVEPLTEPEVRVPPEPIELDAIAVVELNALGPIVDYVHARVAAGAPEHAT